MTRVIGRHRSSPVLPEVSALGDGFQRKWVDPLGDDVDDTLVLLEASPDEQRGATASDPPVAHPAPAGAHDVDEPGLVFEVDEHRALGGGWSLPVGHDATDEDLGSGVEVAQRRAGDRTEAVEDVADEPGGVPIRADARGP